MPSGSSFQLFIVLSKVFQIPLNFFHRKFWIPSIPSEVQFFLLFMTFPILSSLISVSYTSLIVFLNSSLIFFIHGCSIVIFSYSSASPRFHESLHCWGLSLKFLCTIHSLVESPFICCKHCFILSSLPLLHCIQQYHFLHPQLIQTTSPKPPQTPACLLILFLHTSSVLVASSLLSSLIFFVSWDRAHFSLLLFPALVP